MFGKGKCCRWLTENTVGGAGAGGLMTRRRSFLSAQRRMPEEQERWRWREEETGGGGVTAGESKQTHTCLTVRERERSREDGMDGGTKILFSRIKKFKQNFKLKLSHNFFYYISMFSALLQVFYLYVLHVHMVYSILQCSFIFVLFNMLHILLIYILIFYIFLCSIFS